MENKEGRPKELSRKLKLYEVEIDTNKLSRIDFNNKTKRLILELCLKSGVIRLRLKQAREKSPKGDK